MHGGIEGAEEGRGYKMVQKRGDRGAWGIEGA